MRHQMEDESEGEIRLGLGNHGEASVVVCTVDSGQLLEFCIRLANGCQRRLQSDCPVHLEINHTGVSCSPQTAWLETCPGGPQHQAHTDLESTWASSASPPGCGTWGSLSWRS